MFDEMPDSSFILFPLLCPILRDPFYHASRVFGLFQIECSSLAKALLGILAKTTGLCPFLCRLLGGD